MRTSIERKKRQLQTKVYGDWGHTFGIKKNPQEIVSEDILEEKNKRLSKKKSLVSEDIYWEKNKTITNKRLWWVRTHFLDEKKILKK